MVLELWLFELLRQDSLYASYKIIFNLDPTSSKLLPYFKNITIYFLLLKLVLVESVTYIVALKFLYRKTLVLNSCLIN